MYTETWQLIDGLISICIYNIAGNPQKSKWSYHQAP